MVKALLLLVDHYHECQRIGNPIDQRSTYLIAIHIEINSVYAHANYFQDQFISEERLCAELRDVLSLVSVVPQRIINVKLSHHYMEAWPAAWNRIHVRYFLNPDPTFSRDIFERYEYHSINNARDEISRIVFYQK